LIMFSSPFSVSASINFLAAVLNSAWAGWSRVLSCSATRSATSDNSTRFVSYFSPYSAALQISSFPKATAISFDLLNACALIMSLKHSRMPYRTIQLVRTKRSSETWQSIWTIECMLSSVRAFWLISLGIDLYTSSIVCSVCWSSSLFSSNWKKLPFYSARMLVSA